MSTSPHQCDLSQPSSARIYDYLLGGDNNSAADRHTAADLLAIAPWLPHMISMNRSFMWRALTHMLEAGIDQFLDLGSGIPTVGNVHEIARRRLPAARVVYVDREPVTYHHARQLLTGDPLATAVLADARHSHQILHHPETRRLIDFRRPVGLLMVALTPFLSDDDAPGQLIRTYRQHLAPASLLAVSQATDEDAPPRLRAQLARLLDAYTAASGEGIYLRGRDEIAKWLEGMILLDPGITRLTDWQAVDDSEQDNPARLLGYGALAQQPPG
ncbi:MAG: SAM-dependent methyltransferase [Natronosporangium sp.]